MNADSAFMIGTTHSVCQDYAFAKNNYVIVSDGCSTSGDTDIGSRLLVRAASRLFSIPNDGDVGALHKQASRLALDWAQEIGLRPQSVDATLMTAHSHDGGLNIGASGDGVIVLESQSGVLDIFSISFPNGCPLYPAYEHQPERLLAWHANTRAYKEVRQFQSRGLLNPPELVNIETSESVTETMRINRSDYRHVTIISDGVQSFYRTEDSTTSKHLTSIPLDQVLKEVVAFKGWYGAFVARRAKKFQKQCASNGWRHADDLAVGAIYLQD